MKISGLLISNRGEWKEVVFENDNLEEMYNLVDCRCLDVVQRKIGDKYYDIWLDDEGLLKGELVPNGVCLNAYEILMGNLLIVNVSKSGKSVSLELDDIANILLNLFVSKEDFVKEYKTTCGDFNIDFLKDTACLLYEV